MTTDINMSLDDIIKKNKSVKSFNPRRISGQRSNNQQPGRRNNLRTGGGGKAFSGPRFRSNSANPSRSAARFSPYKRVSITNPTVERSTAYQFCVFKEMLFESFCNVT